MEGLECVNKQPKTVFGVQSEINADLSVLG